MNVRVIGIAGLCPNWLEAFDLTSKTKNFSIDCEILSIKLDIEETRLLRPNASSAPVEEDESHPYRSKTSPTKKLAQEFRKLAPNFTETYVAYDATASLIKECARQADYTIPERMEKDVEIPRTANDEDLGVGTGWWYDTLGLVPTFNNWAQVTFLHMYILFVRFRCFPAPHPHTWHQHLLDHFSFSAEERMVLLHNIQARSSRNKYIRDLFERWRGVIIGYDEGLAKGDAVLAAAVWRNVFQAREDVDWRGVGEIVSYMRGVLKGLEGMSDQEIVGGQGVKFGSPGSQRSGVLVRSTMMDSLEKEDKVGSSMGKT
ncbi:MAG: hypothetical protein LQ342_007222 [Letrouitia transgressa]|nr:MAG: hypothetical protein LQ342_007222 [Letrouitia transgressa]